MPQDTQIPSKRHHRHRYVNERTPLPLSGEGNRGPGGEETNDSHGAPALEDIRLRYVAITLSLGFQAETSVLDRIESMQQLSFKGMNRHSSSPHAQLPGSESNPDCAIRCRPRRSMLGILELINLVDVMASGHQGMLASLNIFGQS